MLGPALGDRAVPGLGDKADTVVPGTVGRCWAGSGRCRHQAGLGGSMLWAVHQMSMQLAWLVRGCRM